MNNKTFMPKEKTVVRRWLLVDAADKVVGRLASEIAVRLRGKDKAVFTPHCDTGDFVVVVNADKIRFTGRKMEQKVYRRHTGFIGGVKETVAKTVLAKNPAEVLMHAVRGMLPKNTLGRRQLKKLKVYAGPDHPHARQKPEAVVIGAARPAS
jgi:large subunit ribosomal protein L13